MVNIRKLSCKCLWLFFKCEQKSLILHQINGLLLCVQMNMTTGLFGQQMNPLWSMVIGLLCVAAVAGIIAGAVIGVKST